MRKSVCVHRHTKRGMNVIIDISEIGCVHCHNSVRTVNFERDQLVCFVTRGHRHSQRGSWQRERDREREIESGVLFFFTKRQVFRRFKRLVFFLYI